MKKRICALVLILAMICSLLPAGAAQPPREAALASAHSYENGFCTDGGCADPYESAARNALGVYEISNGGQLYWFSELVKTDPGADARLTGDIVVNSGTVRGQTSWQDGLRAWTPIGSGATPYTGTFDGRGHTVSGLYLGYRDEADGVEYAGLFGAIGANGLVEKLGVLNTTFNGTLKVGAICGSNAGTVRDCYALSFVVGRAGTQQLGGLCGENTGVVKNSYFSGTVNSAAAQEAQWGQICGSYPNAAAVVNCYYEASSTASNPGGGKNIPYDSVTKGVLCLALNGYDSGHDPAADGSQVWYQTLGLMPCQDPAAGVIHYGIYQNHLGPAPGIFDENGFCGTSNKTIYEPATLNEDGVYEIANAGQLCWFSGRVRGGWNDIRGKLTCDIVMNEKLFVKGELVQGLDDLRALRQWVPIAWEDLSVENTQYPFQGEFDGCGHTVGGLYFNDFDTVYRGEYQVGASLYAVERPRVSSLVGLFGVVGNRGVVKNVGVVDSYFDGWSGVDPVAGSNSGAMTQCYAVGNTVRAETDAGGFAGQVRSGGMIRGCYAMGNVQCTRTEQDGATGAFLGSAFSGCAVTDCFCPEGDLPTTGNRVSQENITSVPQEDFTSGALCHLLNEKAGAMVWGQMLYGYTDEHPVFLKAGENEVCQITLVNSGGDNAALYTNPQEGFTLPEICPLEAPKGSRFDYYAASVGGEPITQVDVLSDVNVYITWAVGVTDIHYDTEEGALKATWDNDLGPAQFFAACYNGRGELVSVHMAAQEGSQLTFEDAPHVLNYRIFALADQEYVPLCKVTEKEDPTSIVVRQAEELELPTMDRATASATRLAVDDYMYALCLLDTLLTRFGNEPGQNNGLFEDGRVSASALADLRGDIKTLKAAFDRVFSSSAVLHHVVQAEQDTQQARLDTLIAMAEDPAQLFGARPKDDAKKWAEEIQAITDAAKPGQKIKTLAKELGVSAKDAYKALQYSDAILQGVYAREEEAACQEVIRNLSLIKTGCKVVGTTAAVVATGGAALAAGGTVAAGEGALLLVQATDCIIEVGDEALKITKGTEETAFTQARNISNATTFLLGVGKFPNGDMGDKLGTVADVIDNTLDDGGLIYKVNVLKNEAADKLVSAVEKYDIKELDLFATPQELMERTKKVADDLAKESGHENLTRSPQDIPEKDKIPMGKYTEDAKKNTSTDEKLKDVLKKQDGRENMTDEQAQKELKQAEKELEREVLAEKFQEQNAPVPGSSDQWQDPSNPPEPDPDGWEKYPKGVSYREVDTDSASGYLFSTDPDFDFAGFDPEDSWYEYSHHLRRYGWWLTYNPDTHLLMSEVYYNEDGDMTYRREYDHCDDPAQHRLSSMTVRTALRDGYEYWNTVHFTQDGHTRAYGERNPVNIFTPDGAYHMYVGNSDYAHDSEGRHYYGPYAVFDTETGMPTQWGEYQDFMDPDAVDSSGSPVILHRVLPVGLWYDAFEGELYEPFRFSPERITSYSDSGVRQWVKEYEIHGLSKPVQNGALQYNDSEIRRNNRIYCLKRETRYNAAGAVTLSERWETNLQVEFVTNAEADDTHQYGDIKSAYIYWSKWIGDDSQATEIHRQNVQCMVKNIFDEWP